MRIRSAQTFRRIAAASLLLSCAHDYRDPDPAAGATALVVVENGSADSHESINASMWASVLDVYEGAPDCTKRYLGTVSIANPVREIRLAAGRVAVLSLSVLVPEADATCKVEGAFVPAAGESYRFTVRDNFNRKCSVDLSYANGNEVPMIDWRDCEPPVTPPVTSRLDSRAPSSRSSPPPSTRRA